MRSGNSERPPDASASRPLQSKRVLIASSASKLGKLTAGLQAMGAVPISFPTIEIRPIADQEPLDAALASLEIYTWIVFTSTHGVFYFLLRMKQKGYPMDRLQGPKVCAVGPSTASALRDAGVPVSLVPKEYVAEGVLRALVEFHGGLHNLAGKRILLPRAMKARDLLPRELERAGAQIDIVPCYENVLPAVDAHALRSVLERPPDILAFTSSSAVNNFVNLLGEEQGRRLLQKATVAVLGTITAEAVASHGKTVDVLPKENTTASLLDAIAEFYRGLNPRCE